MREGLFHVAGRLSRSGVLSKAAQAHLDGLRDWFEANLARPERFTRTRNASHKGAHGIAWFKDTAVGHISRMRELASILDEHDIVVDVIETERPGYIVWEDEVQLVAEPFSDTGA